MFKWLNGTWDQAKGYLREDLNHLEAAINQRWAATFSDDNLLKVGAIDDGSIEFEKLDLAAGDIPWVDVSKSGSSLADLTTRGSAQLSDSANIPLKDTANVFSHTGNEFQEILLVDKGLTFPATQVASAGVNTLDDYEEGDWTPVLGGAGGTSGQTYTTRVAKYVKIGQVVYVSAYLILSAKGTITGVVEIQGLPFPSDASSNCFQPLSVPYWSTWVTSFYMMGAYVSPNSSKIQLTASTAAAATTSINAALTTADVNNTSAIMIGGCYRAAA